MFDVISIGAATVDIFVKSNQLVLNGPNLCVPVSSKNEITNGFIGSGGGASNSAVSLSRLGLSTACISLIGNDPFSLFVYRDLKDNHVETDLLAHYDAETTDYSVVLVGPDGGRSIFTNRGNSRLEKEHVNWDKALNTNWFYISSLEGNLDLLEVLVGFAGEHSIKIALNPGNRELAEPTRLIPLLSHVDFLLLNNTESETLTEMALDSPGYWEKLLSYGSRVVAVTAGRQGAYILSSAGKLFSPVIKTNAVDETGAGDAFGSAFVGGIIHHLSLTDSLFWAIKNSASCVAHLGAKPGLLNLQQIKGYAPQT